MKKGRTMITYTCKVCGKEFQRPKGYGASSTPKYCSRACMVIGMGNTKRKRPEYETRVCVVCGKEFTVKSKYSTKTCSSECKRKLLSEKTKEYFKNNLKRESNKCLWCGKEFFDITNSRTKRRKFCSPQCASKYGASLRSKAATITKTCLHCGKEFSGSRSTLEPKKYCSPECSAAASSTRLSDPSALVEVTCTHCGKQFTRYRSAVKKRNYCSMECKAKANSELFKDEEYRANISHKVKEHWERVPNPNKGRTFGKGFREHLSRSKMVYYSTHPEAREAIRQRMLKRYRDPQKLAAIREHVRTRMLNKTYKSGYKEDIGITVRSSLEADFARYLNYKGIRWEYEPVTFELPDGSSYTPDFYLPDLDLYIEIKGYLHIQDLHRIKLFRRTYRTLNYKLLFQDSDEWRSLVVTYRDIIKNWEGHKLHREIDKRYTHLNKLISGVHSSVAFT